MAYRSPCAAPLHMIRYVAFLRGMNLGRRRLEMSRLKALFETLLTDNRQAWNLDAEGIWHQRMPDGPVRASHVILLRDSWGRSPAEVSEETAAERSALAGQGRTVRQTSVLISGRQFQQRTLSPGGLFRLDVDAQRRGQQLLTWLEKGLRVFTVTTDRYLNQVEIGHVARITYPLYGLSGGFTGVVAAWSEQVRKRRLTMTLVG